MREYNGQLAADTLAGIKELIRDVVKVKRKPRLSAISRGQHELAMAYSRHLDNEISKQRNVAESA